MYTQIFQRAHVDLPVSLLTRKHHIQSHYINKAVPPFSSVIFTSITMKFLILIALIGVTLAFKDVALRRPTSQSSSGWGGAPARAVDGNNAGQ